MSADRGTLSIQDNYTAIYSHFFNEDAVDAYELSKEKPIDELDADYLLDAMHRLDYINHVTSDEGELYNCEHFGLEEHQHIMELFNL